MQSSVCIYTTLFLVLFVPTDCRGIQELPLACRNLFSNYTREITVLEIGNKECPYLSALARLPVCAIALSVGGIAREVVRFVSEERLPNVLLLAPSKLTEEMVFSLASCEHFDSVIVHASGLCKGNALPFVNAFLRLGDHIFIETDSSEHEKICRRFGMEAQEDVQGKTLFYLHNPKTCLEKARFTQYLPLTERRPAAYKITSTFESKLFSKGPHFKETPWIHGINMVTFIMLCGVYPTDSKIREELKKCEIVCPSHNDLVLGNILIRGTSLIPIDFEDDRRSGKSSICIQAAVHAFRPKNRRLKNPQKWMKEYYKSLSKEE